MARKTQYRYQGRDAHGKKVNFRTQDRELYDWYVQEFERTKELAKANLKRMGSAPKPTGSFSDRYTKWIDDRLKDPEKNNPDTLHEYRAFLKRYFEPLRDKPVHKITSSDVEPVFAAIAARGKVAHNRARSALSSFFKALIVLGELSVNPVAGIKTLREQPKPIDGSTALLTRPLVSRFLNEAWRQSRSCHAACAVMIYAGPRPEEVVALKRKDVQFDLGLIFIQRVYLARSRVIREYVKSGNRQTNALLAPELASILEQYMNAMPNKDPDAYLFTNADGTPIDYQTFYTAFSEARKRSGLRLTPHGLRHTYASHARMNGIPDAVIAKTMGHTSLKMLSRYAHLDEAYYAGFASKLSFAGTSGATVEPKRKRTYAKKTKRSA